MLQIYRRLTAMLVMVLLTIGCSCQDPANSSWTEIPKAVSMANDFEHVFSAGELRVIDSLLFAYEAKTTRQIAVVTVPESAVEAAGFDSLQVRIFNTWGIGQKIKNNGILLGFSKGLRRVRITTGYGIESILTNQDAEQIIEDHIIPAFRDHDYFAGCMNGINAIFRDLDQYDSLTHDSPSVPPADTDTMKLK